MSVLGVLASIVKIVVGDSSDIGQFNWATHKIGSQEQLEVTSEHMWKKGWCL